MQIVNGNCTGDKPRADVKRELDEILLERLVALNSLRAEEEKQGLVRWLRPEYQNPQGAGATAPAASSQTEMDVDTEAETPVAVVAKKAPWPKGDIDQVKAIIDVLTTSKSPPPASPHSILNRLPHTSQARARGKNACLLSWKC